MLQSKTKFHRKNDLLVHRFISRDEKNTDKSRYRDVLPGELTRVKLQPDGDDKHDFINANYVSGYNNQEKAYIFTQGKSNTENRTRNMRFAFLRTITKHSERLLAYDLAREYLHYSHDNKYS